MPYTDVPAFVARLREEDSCEARALEFLILTVARLRQAAEAAWTEIDLDARLWTVPAARMKAHRDHRVALPERAIVILARQRADYRGSPHVFLRRGGRRPLTTRSLWDLCKRLAGGVTVHEFRSAFRDWVAEQTAHPRELAELALAHQVGSEVERAYLRTDMLERRRALQEEWSAFCGGRRHG